MSIRQIADRFAIVALLLGILYYLSGGGSTPVVAVTPYVITLSEGAKVGCYRESRLDYFSTGDLDGTCGFLLGTSKVRVEQKHGDHLCVFPVSEKGDGWDDVVVRTRVWTPVNGPREPEQCVWMKADSA